MKTKNKNYKQKIICNNCRKIYFCSIPYGISKTDFRASLICEICGCIMYDAISTKNNETIKQRIKKGELKIINN